MQNNTGFRTFTAGASAITKGTRVVISGETVVAGDATNGNTLGFAEHDVAASGLLTVKMLNAGGTFEARVASSVIAGAALYPATTGRLNDAATSGNAPEFFALEAASADGDIIEVTRKNASAGTIGTAVVLTSTNGTMAAAADLAAVKVEGEKIGDDVRAIYAALVTQGILS